MSGQTYAQTDGNDFWRGKGGGWGGESWGGRGSNLQMAMFDLAATGRSAVMSIMNTSMLIAAQSDRRTPDLAQAQKPFQQIDSA